MKKLTLDVDGMKCEGCENAVDSALSGVEGVRRTDVSHEDDRADLVLDDEVSADELVGAVEEAGYQASARS
ncbi:MAG: heavy-metal-associated domain-containing protein [Gemmatimonadota bacterium]